MTGLRNPADLLALARVAGKRAGEHLRGRLGGNVVVDSQQGKDIKAAADREAEQIVMEMLAPAGLPILSEEFGATRADCLNGSCWIIDPLDGTFNFVRGFPICGVSIALWDGSKPVLGMVHDVGSGHCYHGGAGLGAFVNEASIAVSAVAEISQAALATGFPTGRNFGTRSLEAFVGRVQAFKKIRMLGAASLSLAHVAAGRFDAYQEEDIRLWDVAAGWALVEAAGGRVACSAPKAGWKVDLSAWNGCFEMSL